MQSSARQPLVDSDLAATVAAGLAATAKRLPPWLFYDAPGSALFEQITELPEYYPTRTERAIFERAGDAIVAAACPEPATIVELGAGTATKTQLLVAAAVRRFGAARFVPVDVSPTPLAIAAARIAAEVPGATVTPWAVSHDEALPRIAALPGPKVVLFVGSSIGNYEGADAVALLAGVRRTLAPGDALVLGTDLRKDPATLVRAYDDAAGVTAAFNKNVLARINRELGGGFDLDRFAHVAVWNPAQSRIEMHLESIGAQVVAIEALGLRVRFRDGERIHTESSVKYDDAMVDAMLWAAGLRRAATFTDERGWFAVHVAITS